MGIYPNATDSQWSKKIAIRVRRTYVMTQIGRMSVSVAAILVVLGLFFATPSGQVPDGVAIDAFLSAQVESSYAQATQGLVITEEEALWRFFE